MNTFYLLIQDNSIALVPEDDPDTNSLVLNVSETVLKDGYHVYREEVAGIINLHLNPYNEPNNAPTVVIITNDLPTINQFCYFYTTFSNNIGAESPNFTFVVKRWLKIDPNKIYANGSPIYNNCRSMMESDTSRMYHL